MPKLNATKAQEVEKAEESGSFEPIPPGPYKVRLLDVEVKEGKAAPYWNWKFEVVDGEHDGRNLWNNTSLSDKALGMPGGLKQTFGAFGATVDTDTDDLCGRVVGVHVKIRTIQAGERKGEQTNEISALFPASELEGANEPTEDKTASPF